MKLTARDTAGFMQAPDKQAAAVLLYGPDAGLVRERSKAIAAALLGPKPDPMNRMEMAAEHIKADPAILRDELSALSLMGGRRVIVLRDAGDKLSAAIESAFEGLETTTYLIAEADELSPSSSLRQLFEKAPRMAALACYRDEGRSLEDVIRAALTAHGLRAGSDAMQFLTAHLGNDRGITLSEMEKIATYMGAEKEVTLEIAMQLVGHNAQETMDDICHAVALGKPADAHAHLAQLLHEGTQPVAIVRSLLKHFQRLELAQAHIAAGQPPEQAVAALRPPVFFKYVPLLRRELSLWRAGSLTSALNLFLKTEKELKSAALSPALIAGQAIQQAARMAA